MQNQQLTRAGLPTLVSQLTAIFLAAFIGLAIIYVAGHAQSPTLHDAAHDARHAAGFPCH